MPGFRGLVALVLAAVWPLAASAQDEEPCDDTTGRGPLEVTPAAGASAVTLGAQMRIRYSAGYFEDPAIGADPATAFSLVECLDETSCPDGALVPGTVQLVGDVLIFTPAAPLRPRTLYEGTASGVDFPLTFTFRTAGEGVFDRSPPTMGALLDVSSQEVDPSCAAPEGGYRIDVVIEPATDDGPPGDIEYLLYLTRGPMVEAPQLRGRQRNFAAERIPMAFVLEASEAVSPICVTVYAVDGVGNIDDDTEPFCFDPIQGNFFEPICAAAPSSRPAPWAALLLGAPLLLLVARRRR